MLCVPLLVLPLGVPFKFYEDSKYLNYVHSNPGCVQVYVFCSYNSSIVSMSCSHLVYVYVEDYELLKL